jgi:hypothetical protein
VILVFYGVTIRYRIFHPISPSLEEGFKEGFFYNSGME